MRADANSIPALFLQENDTRPCQSEFKVQVLIAALAPLPAHRTNSERRRGGGEGYKTCKRGVGDSRGGALKRFRAMRLHRNENRGNGVGWTGRCNHKHLRCKTRAVDTNDQPA